MRNFQQKSKWKRILESKPVLIVFAIFVLLFTWSVVGLLGKMNDTIDNRRLAEDKLENLKMEKEKLALDIENLQTDKGMEETIRQKFGWAKEGEELIVIVEEKKPVNVDEEKEDSGFFSFFKNLFK